MITFTERRFAFVLISALMVFLVSCRPAITEPAPTPFVESEGEDAFIGVPNPASFYCQEMGYKLDIRDTNDGQVGICVFPDGQECEEWIFLTGSCLPEWTFCQRHGSSIKAGETMGTCLFADGSSCPEYDYFIGECKPPK